MSLIPHPYRGEEDLAALQDLLRAGLRANPRLSYVHPGDIEWWFYYSPVEPPPEESVMLWRTELGDLAAWTLRDPKKCSFDIFIHPGYRTEALFETLIKEVEAEFVSELSTAKTFSCQTCRRADEMFKAAHARAGYQPEPFLVLYEQPLTEPRPIPTLSPGFRFLEALEESDITTRAQAHASAFTWEGHPSRMTPELYRQFVTAPGYDPTLDISIVNEQDEVVAFAMAWADSVTQRAEFEPVGTHKDYQRRGLGRAALLEGMRRLQMRGITIANVATGAEDTENQAFYPAAGFEIVGYNDQYVKPVESGRP